MKKHPRAHLLLSGLVLVIALIWTILLLSIQPHSSLDQRVQSVAEQVRCPICQGESIADSTTTIAFQMRTVAREQLQSGRSEQEVLQYFRDHYGDQIVLTPPWNGFALLAWLVPFALILGGLLWLLRLLREWYASGSTLSDLVPATAGMEDAESSISQYDEAELAAFREYLEQDLAADDRLFLAMSSDQTKERGNQHSASQSAPVAENGE